MLLVDDGNRAGRFADSGGSTDRQVCVQQRLPGLRRTGRKRGSDRPWQLEGPSQEVLFAWLRTSCQCQVRSPLNQGERRYRLAR